MTLAGRDRNKPCPCGSGQKQKACIRCQDHAEALEMDYQLGREQTGKASPLGTLVLTSIFNAIVPP